MSKFVNYKKRDVSLPGGCKDLMDVLTPGKKQGTVSNFQSVSVHKSGPTGHKQPAGQNEIIIGTIADIPKHIIKALGMGSDFLALVVQAQNHWLTVSFFSHGPEFGSLSASAGFPDEPEPKKVVKRFFKHHGLEIPEDTGMPPGFLPDQPVTLWYSIAPRPGDAQSLANLTMELFRHCCQPGENPEIHFDCSW